MSKNGDNDSVQQAFAREQTMKKVVFIIPTLGGGGAEKILVDMVHSLKDEFDITVLTIYDQGTYRERLGPGVNYRSISKKGGWFARNLLHRMLALLPPRFNYRLFVGGGYEVSIGFLEGLACKLASGASKQAKTVAWIHSDISGINPRHSAYVSHQDQTRSYNRFDHIVCVSQEAKDAFVRTVKPDRDPFVIRNPISRTDILRLAGEHPVSVPKTGFTFCAVGRLVPVKGFDRLLLALADLHQEGHPANLWLVGAGEEESKLKKLALELNIQDHVVFFGYQPVPYGIMAASDCCVSASHSEGFALAVAEALVLGKPVLATACTSLNELLNHGAYGLLVDNSQQGLYEGMKAVISQPTLAAQLAQQASQGGQAFETQGIYQQIKDLLNNKSRAMEDVS